MAKSTQSALEVFLPRRVAFQVATEIEAAVGYQHGAHLQEGLQQLHVPAWAVTDIGLHPNQINKLEKYLATLRSTLVR